MTISKTKNKKRRLFYLFIFLFLFGAFVLFFFARIKLVAEIFSHNINSNDLIRYSICLISNCIQLFCFAQFFVFVLFENMKRKRPQTKTNKQTNLISNSKYCKKCYKNKDRSFNHFFNYYFKLK